VPKCFDPRLDVLPDSQKEIWSALSPAPRGTAIALHLGHRQSVDFDFFRTDPLNKPEIRAAFAFLGNAPVLQDAPDTLIALAQMPSGSVKVSFFGGIGFGRVNAPLQTRDGTLLVASLEDLMATKLKAMLDRAEAKDYRDIARLISAGVSLPAGLAAFQQMFKGEPSQVLRAIGYFKDGDLHTLDRGDQTLLRNARDQVGDLPAVRIVSGELAIKPGECE
jgi:hypothetical protein